LITDDYRAIAGRLHDLAHTHAGGRWVALGGGGYQIIRVVPRAWTIYFAELCGGELPHELPWDWTHEVEDTTGVRAPTTFGDEPVRTSAERLAHTRHKAHDMVEALKRGAFEHLAGLR
jgi:acetoin utilization protein AcuC